MITKDLSPIVFSAYFLGFFYPGISIISEKILLQTVFQQKLANNLVLIRLRVCLILKNKLVQISHKKETISHIA